MFWNHSLCSLDTFGMCSYLLQFVAVIAILLVLVLVLIVVVFLVWVYILCETTKGLFCLW